MKNILVSWYGITDLRCSFGFESSGPLIAAMRATHYQQVHVLQYVAENKTATDEEVSEAAMGLLCNISPAQFINKVSNTPAANQHFLKWLIDKAAAENQNSEIIGHEVHLKQLNDSDGIYNAAVSILDEITTEPDIAVTLDISPGTAVMAFVWAFAALRYPGVNIRLITSPRINCPPEEVAIPQGLRQQAESARRTGCCVPSFRGTKNAFASGREGVPGKEARIYHLAPVFSKYHERFCAEQHD